MSNRSYKKSGGRFSSFASALIGAILGGFVVYFLLVAPQSNKKKLVKIKPKLNQGKIIPNQ